MSSLTTSGFVVSSRGFAGESPSRGLSDSLESEVIVISVDILESEVEVSVSVVVVVQ